MLKRRLFTVPRLVVLAVLALACGGGQKGPSAPGVPIDLSRPDDALFAEGLALYDAANASASEARRLGATDLAASAAKEAQALQGYAEARAKFDALPVRFPTSIRLDNAAYLAGRCSYERGTIGGDPLEFQDGALRLDAMQVAFPTSPFIDNAAYFAGRARFQLGDYEAARLQFQRSLAAAPTGPYADNAQYFLGRSDFELGLALAGAGDGLGAHAKLDLAEAELPAVPTTSAFYDNAQYYLGRSYFEEPVNATATFTLLSPAESAARKANLEAAISAFGRTLAVPAATHADSARFWLGRARYAHAFYATAGLDPADLAAAAAAFRAVPATSTYADNALHYLARTYVNSSWRYCTTPHPTDPAPASACAAYAALAAGFPSSSYVASTAEYLAAQTCTCTF
ncbi:tol-pal system YbgF family protein [Anaeromyxobacter sp. Fw109-5]|uniref:tetratricopeptide repeat protein n=1 Tax=Anaeromyxobacter sp. (strain Fw109-5) TaxID=404589 RepID=UPI000158A66A|nr:outer membrane protein assembly factor BamD [Anaeromyxobacter sp. Fw109-5]ABS27661.1 conserved hypothetical protein [Anaeromyxobacter sp. Fw109-5]